MIERYTHPQMAAIWSEDHKFEVWLRVELAACEAWAQLGVISQEELASLRAARLDRQRMAEVFQQTHHDMTAFLAAVTEGLGAEGRFLHHGLTSSDVMDTALSFQMAEAADLLADDISALSRVLERRALEHKDTLMMGRTHGIHAEPITFGLKLALWVEEMRRNAQRLQEARRVAAVGKVSGVVGTYATVPPQVEEYACARLGLAAAPISSQVLQRDRHAQFVTTLAIIGGSLEKFATEIRHLQRTEVREAEEPFEEGQTGSSAMPHKRNPELCERICGQARLLRGYAQTALENMALWHERDLTHSSTERIIIPDSAILLDYMLRLFTYIMDRLQVFPERMRQNLELTKGLVFSQRVLLALVEKGLSRQVAYRLVQGHAMRAWREGLDFLPLLLSDPQITQSLPADELRSLFDHGYYVKYVDEVFRRVGLADVAADTKYGHSLDEWDRAKEEMRRVLVEQANRGQTIPYSDLVAKVQTIRFEPYSYALGAMLGEISSEEDAASRGMLTAVVVHKYGDMQPGPGFFELAKSLGRDTSDVLRCWADELNRVYAYWSKAR